MTKTSNILILCAYYSDSNNANGVCCRNIAEEFVSRGKNVWVVSSCDNPTADEVLNNVKVHYIQTEDYVGKLKSFRLKKGILNKVWYMVYRIYRNIKLLPTYPNNSPSRARKVYELAQNLVDKNQIDTILGTYRPYESIYASIRLKKKYKKSLKVITYHLDLLTRNDEWKGFASKILKHQANQSVNKERKVVDAILIPENFFDGKESFDNKLIPVGFPLYIKRMEYKQSNWTFNHDEINMVYIGSLDKNNRNPQYAITLVEELSKRLEKRVVLHIWGKLWDAETFDMVNSSKNVQYHGTVENEYVQDILMKGDVLLNVSNKVTYNYLPSKIFQYFAMEKPIVNIVQHKKDCSLRYFEKYGLAFNYRTDFPQAMQIYDLMKYVEALQNGKLETKLNKHQFERFTPEYNCDKIESAHA